MWLVAKRAEDGAAIIMHDGDVMAIWQSPASPVAVISFRDTKSAGGASLVNQTVTQIGVHHDIGSAIAEMTRISRGEE